MEHRWHRRRHSPEDVELRDRKGGRYRLHARSGRVFFLYRQDWLGRSMQAGDANLCPGPDGEVLLGNLCIEPPYRGLGLGSVLLEKMVEQARALGGLLLWGNITPDDLGKTPHLLEFYQRHGFTVAPSREPGRAAHSVERPLL